MSAVQQEVKNVKWLQHTGTHRPHKNSPSMLKLKQHHTKFPNTHLLLYHMISSSLGFAGFHLLAPNTFVFLSFPLQGARSEILMFVRRSKGKIFSNKLVSSEVLAKRSQRLSVELWDAIHTVTFLCCEGKRWASEIGPKTIRKRGFSSMAYKHYLDFMHEIR